MAIREQLARVCFEAVHDAWVSVLKLYTGNRMSCLLLPVALYIFG